MIEQNFICNTTHVLLSGGPQESQWYKDSYRTTCMEIATSSSPSNAKSLRPRTPLLAASDPVSVRFLCGTITSLNCRPSGMFNEKHKVLFVERGGVKHQKQDSVVSKGGFGGCGRYGILELKISRWNLSERLVFAMHQGRVSFLKAGCSSVSAPMVLMAHSFWKDQSWRNQEKSHNSCQNDVSSQRLWFSGSSWGVLVSSEWLYQLPQSVLHACRGANRHRHPDLVGSHDLWIINDNHPILNFCC